MARGQHRPVLLMNRRARERHRRAGFDVAIIAMAARRIVTVGGSDRYAIDTVIDNRQGHFAGRTGGRGHGGKREVGKGGEQSDVHRARSIPLIAQRPAMGVSDAARAAKASAVVIVARLG